MPLTHAPAELHVCGVRPVHRSTAGAQTPVHAPLTHAWFVQAVLPTHAPAASQVCGVWPLHCLAAGEHTPMHLATPAATVHAEFVQAVPTHAPFASQFWGICPLHCAAPGAQTPWHAPETQAWLVHAAAVPQTPAASQV